MKSNKRSDLPSRPKTPNERFNLLARKESVIW